MTEQRATPGEAIIMIIALMFILIAPLSALVPYASDHRNHSQSTRKGNADSCYSGGSIFGGDRND